MTCRICVCVYSFIEMQLCAFIIPTSLIRSHSSSGCHYLSAQEIWLSTWILSITLLIDFFRVCRDIHTVLHSWNKLNYLIFEYDTHQFNKSIIMIATACMCVCTKECILALWRGGVKKVASEQCCDEIYFCSTCLPQAMIALCSIVLFSQLNESEKLQSLVLYSHNSDSFFVFINRNSQYSDQKWMCWHRAPIESGCAS